VLEYLRQSKVLAGGPGGGQGVAYYKGSSHVVWDLEAGCKYPRPLISSPRLEERKRTTN
jgi:hypothetical protein